MYREFLREILNSRFDCAQSDEHPLSGTRRRPDSVAMGTFKLCSDVRPFRSVHLCDSNSNQAAHPRSKSFRGELPADAIDRAVHLAAGMPFTRAFSAEPIREN